MRGESEAPHGESEMRERAEPGRPDPGIPDHYSTPLQ